MKKLFTLSLLLLHCICFVIQASTIGPKLDPVKFTISTNASQVGLNEQFEIKITARYLHVPANHGFILEGATAFRLKLITPDGFVKTGGDFHDFVGTELGSAIPSITYTLKGQFTSASNNGIFQLLRSHKNADNQSTFIEVGRLVYNMEKDPVAENPTARILLSGAPGDVPYLTLNQLRNFIADPARAVYITDPGVYGLFRYDSLSTATDDGRMTIVSGTKRFTRVFESYVNARWFGIKGDGVTDESSLWQVLLDAPEVKTIYFPRTSASYRIKKVAIKSNKTLIFENGSIVKGISIPLGEKMVDMTDIENVAITGHNVTFTDVSTTHSGSQPRIAIYMRGVRNVLIDGISSNDSGDGFYIGSTNTLKYSEHVVLRNCSANANQRQGLTIASGKDILVENCRFTNSNGAPPAAGIDIEPNLANEIIQDIRIVNCITSNNQGPGIQIHLNPLRNAGNLVNLLIDNHTDDGSIYGVIMSKQAGKLDGTVQIKNSIWRNNRANGFIADNHSARGPRVTVTDCNIYNANSSGQALNYYSAAATVCRNTTDESDAEIGNIHFYNLNIEDNREVPLTRAGILFGSTTNPIVDCSVINPSSFTGIPVAHQLYPYGGLVNIKDQNEILTDSLPYPGKTLGISYYKSLLHNGGQSGSRVVTLGSMSRWISETTVEVRTAQEVKIKPDAGDNILPLSTVPGKSIKSNVIGSRISFKKINDDNWVITNMVGTWTVEP